MKFLLVQVFLSINYWLSLQPFPGYFLEVSVCISAQYHSSQRYSDLNLPATEWPWLFFQTLESLTFLLSDCTHLSFSEPHPIHFVATHNRSHLWVYWCIRCQVTQWIETQTRTPRPDFSTSMNSILITDLEWGQSWASRLLLNLCPGIFVPVDPLSICWSVARSMNHIAQRW